MLLEVAVAMPIVLVALGLFVRMLIAGTQLRTVADEDWIVTSAAQEVVEEMRNEDYRQAFLQYNTDLFDGFDGFGGPGTAPGNRFAGPLYRIEQHLRDVAAGEWPGTCRIRKSDDLRERCQLVNEALESAREQGAANVSRIESEPTERTAT